MGEELKSPESFDTRLNRFCEIETGIVELPDVKMSLPMFSEWNVSFTINLRLKQEYRNHLPSAL